MRSERYASDADDFTRDREIKVNLDHFFSSKEKKNATRQNGFITPVGAFKQRVSKMQRRLKFYVDVHGSICLEI